MAGFTDKPLNGRSEDIFDVEKYIKGLSSFILECDTPMTVAVQGDWGSGKTSFMMLIQEELVQHLAVFSVQPGGPAAPAAGFPADGLSGPQGCPGRLYKKLPAHPWRRAVPCGPVGGQHGDRSGCGGRG